MGHQPGGVPRPFPVYASSMKRGEITPEDEACRLAALRDRHDVVDARLAWGDDPEDAVPPLVDPRPVEPAPPAPPRPVLQAPPLVVGQHELRFTLPASADVRLRVLDLNGRLVREIRAGEMPAGMHVLRWDQHDTGGQRVASGMYFATLEAGAERWRLRWVVYR